MYLSNMFAVRTRAEGVILNFLRNEKPYAVCVARVGIPHHEFLGFLRLLDAMAQQMGLDVRLVFAQDEGEKDQTH